MINKLLLDMTEIYIEVQDDLGGSLVLLAKMQTVFDRVEKLLKTKVKKER